MPYPKLALFVAIAMLCLAAPTKGAPIITLGNYDLLPNTPGQKIPLYVSGIVPNDGPTFPNFPGNVHGMFLAVAINDGGVINGGLPGPAISAIDVDSGPTIWVAPNSPAGHLPPQEIPEGPQARTVGVLTVSGWVNVTEGLLATLVIDTSGFNSGTYSLKLSGPTLEDFIVETQMLGVLPDGTNIVYEYYGGTAGQITIVPEPSTLILGLFAVAGLAAVVVRKRRPRRV